MDKRNLSLMLILFGGIELLIPLIPLFLILPQLYRLNQSIGANMLTTILAFIFLGLVIIVSLLQIIRGMFFSDSNTKTSINLLMAGGILILVTVPVIIVTIILPISQIVGSIAGN